MDAAHTPFNHMQLEQKAPNYTKYLIDGCQSEAQPGELMAVIRLCRHQPSVFARNLWIRSAPPVGRPSNMYVYPCLPV